MIQIENLEKVYRTEEVETKALNKVSLVVNDGEFVAIMGPSGCGKSTLLNIIGLLDEPDGGSIKFAGTEIAHYNERKRADLRKRNLGFVFQSFNLIEELTVLENVELPLIYLGVGAAERKQKVEKVLEKMQIMHRRNHFPQQLSGGQQQRVAVARAVINAPRLILADEPTGNLDSSNGNEVMELLTELNEAGTTIIMVTHSEHDARYAHRVIRLLDGEVVMENVHKQFTV
ncbi:ABC transporter ATP-binding protein [Hymenobacter qilianensis]|uniref:ABC transporter ATP-binding protein n=2 Tax=Hymenobacter qilianensis TaxID=1385715 RepID=A0A7H0GSU4_9BACT|nr:ABC transporter ATP-binding protein [Hymenobacter qilianensis]QNP51360.1 ABC transporter ATP-binding protein [Hymenobacter qilianensis]GGF76009.1 ABC transporter ATP-binding protein [Hymenobacter qilianensis]